MVKHLFWLLCLPVFLGAGQFSANVNNTQVSLGETISLQLTLKEATFKEAPSMGALKKHFIIHSQQQMSSTSIVNGKAATSITWILTLSPIKEGALQIPSITIATKEGMLATQPISLKVSKEETAAVEGAKKPSILAKVSHLTPYKNEPFIYTALLISKDPLYNVRTQKLQLDDAILEMPEEPKLEEKVVEGVLFHCVTLTYLITPLKPGTLKIPPLAIQGSTPHKKKSKRSLFQDDIDLFAMMQGFDQIEPFVLATEELELQVQPAVADVKPWLVARNLTLEEQWPDSAALRVGEPISRTLLIKSEGLKASQLPHLEELQAKTAAFKTYADKPESTEKLVQGLLHSTRQEHYTLIPEQSGIWELPEIAIDYWDSVAKMKKTARLPARTLEILPALIAATGGQTDENKTVSFEDEPIQAPITASSPSFWMYGVIGALAFFLLAALVWGYVLYRRIARLTQDPTQVPKKQSIEPKARKVVKAAAKTTSKGKQEFLPDLNPT